jgi:hypothetical protein
MIRRVAVWGLTVMLPKHLTEAVVWDLCTLQLSLVDLRFCAVRVSMGLFMLSVAR